MARIEHLTIPFYAQEDNPLVDTKEIKALFDNDRTMYPRGMIQIVKMQGLGNKFVVIHGPYAIESEQIKDLCDPKNDGGVDGVLVVSPLDNNSMEMKYWNADGSKAEMCGNGLRCAVRFAVDNKMVEPGKIRVRTDAGMLEALWSGKQSNVIEVQVGKVVLGQVPLILCGLTFYTANVGNPHAITFVDDIQHAPVQTIGPVVESNEHFPHKSNVEFVRMISPSKIYVRTWERGVGETKACGTGMVAATATAVMLKDAKLPLSVEVEGGKAEIWLDSAGYWRMLGPAEYI